MAKTHKTVAQILAGALEAADLAPIKVTDTEVRVTKSITISVDATGNSPKFTVSAYSQLGKARRSVERAVQDVQKALKGSVSVPTQSLRQVAVQLLADLESNGASSGKVLASGKRIKFETEAPRKVMKILRSLGYTKLYFGKQNTVIKPSDAVVALEVDGPYIELLPV